MLQILKQFRHGHIREWHFYGLRMVPTQFGRCILSFLQTTASCIHAVWGQNAVDFLRKDVTHRRSRGICLNKPHHGVPVRYWYSLDMTTEPREISVNFVLSLLGNQEVKKEGQLSFMTLHDIPWGVWGSCNQVQCSSCLTHRLLLVACAELYLFCPISTLYFFSVVKMGICIFNTLFFSPWQIQIEKCRRANKTL